MSSLGGLVGFLAGFEPARFEGLVRGNEICFTEWGSELRKELTIVQHGNDSRKRHHQRGLGEPCMLAGADANICWLLVSPSA